MSKSPFVLPAGVELDASDGTLSLKHDGDVRLEQTMGLPLGTVEAGGDLVLDLEVATGTLRAGGKLKITGRVEAVSLSGGEIHLGDADVKARAISADRKIVIGRAKLAVDVIMAPVIELDPQASGRVTVIESRNERGATKIKGGFSVAEYDEIIGDAEDFLAERGLQPLGEDIEIPEPEPEQPEEDDGDDATMPSNEPVVSAEEEDIDDPLSLSVEDLEPVEEDEMQGKLSEALGRIIAAYANQERPPSIDDLQRLVQGRDYDELRDGITDVWNGLLTFHQERGIRPHHQVTHAFNVIHGLVQEA